MLTTGCCFGTWLLNCDGFQPIAPQGSGLTLHRCRSQMEISNAPTPDVAKRFAYQHGWKMTPSGKWLCPAWHGGKQ